MAERARMSRLSIFLLTAACFVVVVAGMKAASSLIVPFLVAVFVSIICMPALVWLRSRNVPNVLSVVIVLAGILVFWSIIVTLMGTSLSSFSENLPTYQAKLTEKISIVTSWLQSHHIKVPDNPFEDHFNPSSIMNLAASTFMELRTVLTDTVMILITVIFILFEATEIPEKIRAAVKDPKRSLARMGKIGESVNRYLAIKTLFSFATGVCIAIWLAVLGVDYPVLWGVLAFLLNFIPNIGAIIAAIPAVLLAFIQYGVGHAFIAILGYVVINTAFGTLLEPKFLGRGLGLSTLVVFLSLVFWGWILGPVGMFLSVPLTMIVKIAMEGNEETRWFSVLIGSRVPRRARQRG